MSAPTQILALPLPLLGPVPLRIEPLVSSLIIDISAGAEPDLLDYVVALPFGHVGVLMLPYIQGVLLEVVPECSGRLELPSRRRWLGVQSQAEGAGAPILGTRTHLLVLAMQPM